MNSKILSVLLLLIVAIGFSGVASAATVQKLVSPEIPAWDELISDAQDAYNETITEAIPAYNEEIAYRDLYIVQGPNELQDWLDFIYSHEGAVSGYGFWTYFPEVSHIETVVDVPAHYVSQLVSEAYDEVVDPVYETQEVRTVEFGYQDHWGNSDKQKQHDKAVKFADKQVDVHGYYGYYITDHPGCGQGHWTVHFLDDVLVEEGYTIHHDAVYEDVFVPATFKDVKVVDEVAHYLVKGKYTIAHPEVPAVIVEHPAVPAVYVHHPAIPAVYETIEVVDPVTPDEVPMQPTGGSAVVLALAILAVLAGIGIAASRRK